MLKSLKIQRFKRFNELNFSQFKRVNLLAGKNNTGQTGVLEALFLLIKYDDAGQLPGTFRNSTNVGNMSENFWKWQFLNRDVRKPIIISTATEEFSDYAVALTQDTQSPPEFERRNSVDNFMLSVRANRRDGKRMPHDRLNLDLVSLPVRPTDPQKDAVDYDRVVLKAGGEERLEKLVREIDFEQRPCLTASALCPSNKAISRSRRQSRPTKAAKAAGPAKGSGRVWEFNPPW